MAGRRSKHSTAAPTPRRPFPSWEESRQPLRLQATPPLFDAYLVVDWSARKTPATGRDSIWWAIATWRHGVLESEPPQNPSTRHAAFHALRARLIQNVEQGVRTLIGFDFPLGYPKGLAAALGLVGAPPWRAVWNEWSRLIHDAPDNSNRRFDDAATLNARISGGMGPFWGHPRGYTSVTLGPRKSFTYPVGTLAERRLTDERVRKAQPGWKLMGQGCPGSQALLGIPYLHQLLEDPQLASVLEVWPFQTGFTSPRLEAGHILMAEVYPSLVPVPTVTGTVKDQLQVEALSRAFATLDTSGALAPLFTPHLPPPPEQWKALCQEEGWILGVS